MAVGSSHAMTERTAVLDLDLIARLRDAVPVPLVLHGSSGVPPHLLAAAVSAGIVKVNIGTALNIAFTAAVRARLEADARGSSTHVAIWHRPETPWLTVVADAVRSLRVSAQDRLAGRRG